MKRYRLILFFLGVTALAKAQFIVVGQYNSNDYYHAYIPDTVFHSVGLNSYPIDLNNDGIADFKFTLYPGSGALGATNYYCTVAALNTNKVAITGVATSCISNTAYNFMLNDTITSSAVWSNSAYLYYIYSSMGGGCGTQFAPNNSGYIGLQINTATQTVYGWVNVISLYCFYTSGFYDLKLSDLACENLTVGIPDKRYALEIQSFPNPSSNKISITIPMNANGNIRLFDITGKNLKSSVLENGSAEINVSELENGIYFLRVTTVNKVVSKKIIVQH